MVPERSFLLDSSAILALIEDEEGAERVERVIDDARASIPFVVLMEVYYITLRERGRPEADRRYAMLKELSLEISWQIDEATLLTAARFKAEHGISLADAQIAAFAARGEATLIHKDPEFEALADEVALEPLPYKGRRNTEVPPAAETEEAEEDLATPEGREP